MFLLVSNVPILEINRSKNNSHPIKLFLLSNEEEFIGCASSQKHTQPSPPPQLASSETHAAFTISTTCQFRNIRSLHHLRNLPVQKHMQLSPPPQPASSETHAAFTIFATCQFRNTRSLHHLRNLPVQKHTQPSPPSLPLNFVVPTIFSAPLPRVC